MIKKGFLSLVLFIAILMSACEKIDLSKLSDKDLQRVSKELVVCNSPYMRHGTDCCLDKDDNSICDSDEEKSTKVETPSGLNPPISETPANPIHPNKPDKDFNKCDKNILKKFPKVDEEVISKIPACKGDEICESWISSEEFKKDTPNINLCSFLKHEESYTVCWIYFSAKLNDHCLCELADYSRTNRLDEDKIGCYSSVGKYNKDIRVCELIKPIDENSIREREKCFASVAKQTKNPDLCNKIENQEVKIGCYSSVGKYNNDTRACELIKPIDENSIREQGECFASVAKQTKNPDLCNKIENQVWKKACNDKKGWEI